MFYLLLFVIFCDYSIYCFLPLFVLLFCSSFFTHLIFFPRLILSDYKPLILNEMLELFNRARGDNSSEWGVWICDDSGIGGVRGGELDKVSKSRLRGIVRKQENKRKILKHIEFKKSSYC